MSASAAIYGCHGLTLSDDERDFFRDVTPWGFILFARNCDTPEQIRALCAELREAAGNTNTPILIDQEGGRVARLKPPRWHARPPARRFGDLYLSDPERAREAVYLCARLIANDLRALDITVDCAPVLDVPVTGAHDIIGDRAFAEEPATIIDFGRAAIDGFLDGGVLPVVKHIPGHGRATVDSHQALPRVSATRAALSARDFVTFRGLNHAPLAMTAHVIYEAIDAERPATTSGRVLRDVVRGEIGFDNLLMSDDLSMAALQGPLATRTKAAFLAGCDVVLHCNGDMGEMKSIAKETGRLTGLPGERAQRALNALRAPSALDASAAQARLDMLMGVLA